MTGAGTCGRGQSEVSGQEKAPLPFLGKILPPEAFAGGGAGRGGRA